MSVAVYLAVVRVAVMWGVMWVLFVGLGLLVSQRWSTRRVEALDLPQLPWLGWGAAIAILQLWHLTRPVDTSAFLLVVGLGLMGLILHVRALLNLFVDHGWACRWLLPAAVVFALWVANHAVMQPGVYDSGLYHLSGVRWACEFAIVPGLGNLHGRLAYNNTSLLYTAMLDIGPFSGRSHHLASGFLVLLLLTTGLHSMWGLARSTHRPRPSMRFYALFTGPVLVWAVNSGYLSSPSPDVPCFLLAVVLSGNLLNMLGAPRVDSSRSLQTLGSLCFLALIGVTVKLSFAAFGCTVMAVALGTYLVRSRNLSARMAALGLVAALVLVVLVPWCIRGVILSGYPAYPSTIFSVPVDWAIPAASVQHMAREIQGWARMPGTSADGGTHGWTWVVPWFRRVACANAVDFTAPLIVLTLAAGLCLACWRHAARRWRAMGGALLPALVGCIVWFLSAPDPRFQGSMLWILGLGVLMIGMPPGRRATLMAAGGLAVVMVAVFLQPLDLLRTWKDPGPAKRVPMRTVVTESGLHVFVPIHGDQVWDSPLPATPYCSPRLRLRNPGVPADGFTRRHVVSSGSASSQSSSSGECGRDSEKP